MRSVKLITRSSVAAILVIQLLSGIPFGSLLETNVAAQSPAAIKKVSDDLQDALDRSPDDLLSVILQTPSTPSKGLSTAVRQSNGSINRAFKNLNVLAVKLPAREVATLAARSDTSFLSLDRPTKVTGHLETTTGADQARSYGTTSTGPIDGSGIGIAILDSGIDAAHHSFLTSRIATSVDFTGEGRTDDPYGHGTHVASIAAGNNHISFGAYTGIAPAARLINVRVLDSQGVGSVSSALAGIDWCITNKAVYNIKVLNLSFGTTAVSSYVNDPLCKAVRRAVSAGLVVCVAAGNTGKDESGNKVYGAIHSPGIEPSAITVGAGNTFGTDSRMNDSVATYSSRGPTRGYYTDSRGVRHYDNLIKPDIIAPGNKLIGAKAPGNKIVTANPELDTRIKGPNSHGDTHEMMRMSGTSMATPAVSGAVALLLERNPSLTPNLVKAVLEYTAQPLAGFNNLEQGAGLLNIEGAVRLAGLIRTDLSNLVLGAPLLTSPAPAQRTTIAGTSFPWGGGIIQRWNFIYGDTLMLRYQGIYGAGVLLTEGVILSRGSLHPDGVLLCDGTILSDGVLISDGTVLANGTVMADGTVFSDGTVMPDGTVFSDGTVMSDSTLAASTSSAAANMAQSVVSSGDETEEMEVIPDGNY